MTINYFGPSSEFQIRYSCLTLVEALCMCLRVWEPTKGSVCPTEFKCLCILSSCLARWQRPLPVPLSLNRDLHVLNRAYLFYRKVFFPCAQIVFFKERMILSAISNSCTYPRCVWLLSRFLLKRLNKTLLYILCFLFPAPNEKVKSFSGYFQILLSTLFYRFNYPCIKKKKKGMWFRQADFSKQSLHF